MTTNPETYSDLQRLKEKILFGLAGGHSPDRRWHGDKDARNMEIFVKCCLMGISQTDVARAMGMTQNRVRQIAIRQFYRLQEELGK